jgi:hypothetical protein
MLELAILCHVERGPAAAKPASLADITDAV